MLVVYSAVSMEDKRATMTVSSTMELLLVKQFLLATVWSSSSVC